MKPLKDGATGKRGGTRAFGFRMRIDGEEGQSIEFLAKQLKCTLSEAVRISVAHYRGVLAKTRGK
jgi:hypothetical protein